MKGAILRGAFIGRCFADALKQLEERGRVFGDPNLPVGVSDEQIKEKLWQAFDSATASAVQNERGGVSLSLLADVDMTRQFPVFQQYYTHWNIVVRNPGITAKDMRNKSATGEIKYPFLRLESVAQLDKEKKQRCQFRLRHARKRSSKSHTISQTVRTSSKSTTQDPASLLSGGDLSLNTEAAALLGEMESE
eukprot:Sspe_Gene.53599::Locus_29611_Transcript_2_4_Confidence_0.500_Length_1380::g.53599::m.53599